MISIGTAELNSFISTNFKREGSSSSIDIISSKLYRLQIGFPRFDKEQHLDFLDKMVEILTDNEGTFQKEGSVDFLGGFHSQVSNIFRFLDYYSQVEGLPEKDCSEWRAFREVLERYRQYGYPVLTTFAHLAYWGIWDKGIVKKHIKNALFSSSISLVNDAGNALVYMAEKQGKRVNQSIVKSIISKTTYVIDGNTHAYLYVIRELLVKRGISKEARIQLEEWINSLPARIEHLALSEEIKDDVRYYANQIAGVMSIVWSNCSSLNAWKDYMKNDYIKNDVRNGFEVGVSLATYSQ